MLLLNELTQHSEGFARCQATIGQGNSFLDADGKLEAVALVEMLAQGSAALQAAESAGHGEGPKFGYLVGIKEFDFCGRADAGDTIIVEVRHTFAMEPMSMMDGRILRDAAVLASGTLKVWAQSGEVPSPAEHTPAPLPQAATPEHAPNAQSAIHNPQSAIRLSLIHRAVLESGSRAERSADGTRATAEFNFDESFPGFDGHFPGSPLLPGIMLLKAALVLCEDLLERPLELSCIEKAKFAGRVLPGQSVRLEVRLTPTADHWKVRASLTSGAGAIASFRFMVMPGQAAGREAFSHGRDEA